MSNLMKTMGLILVVGLGYLVLPMICPAATLVEQDFAYAIPLALEDEAGAIYEVVLPGIVYQRLTRVDMGDMRIFNQAGGVVSHTLQQTAEEISESEKEVEERLQLKHFALYRPATKVLSDEVRIHVSTNGAIVDVATQGAGTKKNIVRAYLIDASHLDKNIKQLLLEWKNTGQHFFEEVNVDYSNDLNQWHRLVSGATLADLAHQNVIFGKKYIDLPVGKYKYLRLTWPMGSKNIQLNRVIAMLSMTIQQEPMVAWAAIKPVKITNNIIDYDSQAVYPVKRVKIKLPEKNVAYKIELLTRFPKQRKWKSRFSGLIYRMEVKGKSFENEVIKMRYDTPDPFWRVQFMNHSESSQQIKEPPLLELEYFPHKLLFMARGKGPFKLAYGSVSVQPLEDTLSGLVKSVKPADIKSAKLGEEIVLGGEAKLKPPLLPTNWQEWMVWLIML
ncbi:DUF3999 domain-containing protein, partial [bacterium]|nr:DUF3999 domain-containing protein [bacterium]